MRARVALLLLAVAVAGCGTTVPQAAGGSQQPVGGGDGLTAPLARASTPAGGALSSAPASAGGQVRTGGVPQAPSSSAAAPIASSLPGSAPRQPVKVGFVVASNSTDAAFKAAGVGALQVGDQKAQAKVVVADLNAHGGLAGHLVQPVFHTPDSSSGTYEEADQVTCTAFTQDTRVAFVISTVAHTQLLHACLAKAGVPLLDDDLGLYDAKVVVPGLLFMPSSWLLDRLMRNEIDALARRGFFDDPGRVGVLLYDLPGSQRVLQGTVLPRLANYGKTKVDVAASPFTTEGAANQQANVLKFRNDGVTRVIQIAFSPIGFMLAAESQAYHPRYALDSAIGPDTVRASVPADQLQGMIGVGWVPSADTGSATPVTAAGGRCLALMRKAGQDTTNSTTASLMQQFCDAGWFLQAATSAAGAADAGALRRGALLTRGYESASSFAADMTAGRPDGLSGYRDLAYQTGCSCIQYVGGIRPAT
jgi:hypothetical protein